MISFRNDDNLCFYSWVERQALNVTIKEKGGEKPILKTRPHLVENTLGYFDTSPSLALKITTQGSLNQTENLSSVNVTNH